jgi:hypothetical protein
MVDLTRRKFLRSAAIAVPATAVMIAAVPNAEIMAEVPKAPPPLFKYTPDKLITHTIDGEPERNFPAPFEFGKSWDTPMQPVPEGEAKFALDLKTRQIILTEPCTGDALYSGLMKHWREDKYAITHSFPMMAITNEVFHMEQGWTIRNMEHLRNAAFDDDGLGRAYLGLITFGGYDMPESGHLEWAADNRPLFRRFRAKGGGYNGKVNEPILMPQARKLYLRYVTGVRGAGRLPGIIDVGKLVGIDDFTKHYSTVLRVPICGADFRHPLGRSIMDRRNPDMLA